MTVIFAYLFIFDKERIVFYLCIKRNQMFTVSMFLLF